MRTYESGREFALQKDTSDSLASLRERCFAENGAWQVIGLMSGLCFYITP
jgi:hypothetical protein